MATLALPAIATYNSQLWLGGPTSPPSYVLQARIGNIKFNGMTIDMVDVSNQTSTAHRMLGTLLKPGDVTFDLYVEPASAQDQILIDLVITAPPALQQWKIVAAAGTDGTAFFFNGYLAAFPLDLSIGKAMIVPTKISIDNNVTVVFGIGPL